MRWKWILGISAVVVVVLIVTAYIVIASYDFNKFKPRITELAKQYTGRDLILGGDIELSLKSPRPQIKAKFLSQKMDLRPFINQDSSDGKTETKTKKSATKSDKVFSAEPFDLQAFQQVDAVISLRADQIFTHRIALDKFNLDVSLKNGHLIVKPLTTDIGGGNLSSALDLLAKGNHATVTTNVTAKKIDNG